MLDHGSGKMTIASCGSIGALISSSFTTISCYVIHSPVVIRGEVSLLIIVVPKFSRC